MKLTQQELRAAKKAVIREINERSPDLLDGLSEMDLPDLEALRDSLPARPDPDSEEAKARRAALAAREGSDPAVKGTAETQEEADAKAAAEAEKEAEKARKAKATGYVVAPGASFATARGIVGPGERILVKDFGERAAFDRQKAAGKIVDNTG